MGMMLGRRVLTLEDHLLRSLREYADAAGKTVEELTAVQRQQALCRYMRAGKHLEGAEEAMEDEAQ
jgi:hypothetical protein